MALNEKKSEGKEADTIGTGSSVRDNAEKRLADIPKSPSPLAGRTLEELVHELQVHQIELEMQNEALREAHLALEESRDKYLDLYEFAPVGYLTLTDKGLITNVNLTAATLLGRDRNKMVKARFSKYLAATDADTWHRFFLQVLKSEGKQACTLMLARGDGSVFPARLESVRITSRSQGTAAVRIMLLDISDIRRAEESLCQTIEKLNEREHKLTDALTEKEVLLAEIHHRVKNNLTAFIALLSLEGSIEETPAGRELKKDLQNRARSMALIHETLYRTNNFSHVDMEFYLTSLIEQIIKSYSSPQSIRTVIEVKGVELDLARATPAGLIVNEIVTNSLKHAFPAETKTCLADQENPCTIGIRMTEENGSYLLTVYDNGIGMAAGYDPQTAKTLGLKLVNFLAKYQMRAKVEVNTTKGTEFVFQFRQRDNVP
jgi:PAS domain S-box-containing protein